VTEDLGNIVYEEIRKYIITSSAQYDHHSASASTTGTRSSPIESVHDEANSSFLTTSPAAAEARDARLTRRLNALDRANETQVVYIVGKEQLRLLHTQNNFAKRFVLGIFLWVRENTRAKVASMRIPIEKLVEVGFVKEI
jgi:KUP system potassium uptake protein